MLKVNGKVLEKLQEKKKNDKGEEYLKYSLVIQNSSKFNDVVKVKEDSFKQVQAGQEVEINVNIFPYVSKQGMANYSLSQI
jgi:hypothetical protein